MSNSSPSLLFPPRGCALTGCAVPRGSYLNASVAQLLVSAYSPLHEASETA